jgi:hypothetical protein
MCNRWNRGILAGEESFLKPDIFLCILFIINRMDVSVRFPCGAIRVARG